MVQYDTTITQNNRKWEGWSVVISQLPFLATNCSNRIFCFFLLMSVGRARAIFC